MRLPLIAANWKMNTTVREATRLVLAMRDRLDGIAGVEKVLCPPFVSLAPLAGLLKESSIKLGAQNLFYEASGAYTGEISPAMVAELCQYVIVGHSERRRYFNETGEIVNRKVVAALSAGLKPILCVGEGLAENEAGRTEEVVTGQLEASLADIASPHGLVIAYEPVWAIGTGKAATGHQAGATIALIRRAIARRYGDGLAAELRILYGGSVTAGNVAEFMQQAEIDGALVGGASLDATAFVEIVAQTSAMGGTAEV